MTPSAFRRLALALPDAIEGSHHGHPDFRAHGSVFASLHPDGRRAMVKVPPAVQQRLLAEHFGVFTAATGAWGRAGCTLVLLADAATAVVREALQEAWQHAGAVGAHSPTRRRRPRA